MAILKRFEIWLLLFLVVGLLVFAFKTEESIEEKPEVVTKEPTATGSLVVANQNPDVPVVENETGGKNPEPTETEIEGALRIDKIEVIPNEQGRVVDLTLSGRSGEEGDVSLDEKTLRVTNENGEEIPRFFLPFQKDPSLDAKEVSLVTLKYWLRDESDTLWINYRDQRLKAELSR